MSLPKISIVTVSFNQARFLEACIRSVLEQDYPHVEYIVIDGGSTDGSVEIIKRYAGRIAYWVSESDKGQTDALIKGFQCATGDILGWINSDDQLEPGALREVAGYFQAHPEARVVTGDVNLIREEGSLLRVQHQIRFIPFLWFNDHNYIGQSSTFWRRDLYAEVGGLDPSFQVNMDGDLFIRFAQVTRLHHVRRLWSRFRVYEQQKTSRLSERLAMENEIIRRRHLGAEWPGARLLKRCLARPLRLLLKLFSGCYSP